MLAPCRVGQNLNAHGSDLRIENPGARKYFIFSARQILEVFHGTVHILPESVGTPAAIQADGSSYGRRCRTSPRFCVQSPGYLRAIQPIGEESGPGIGFRESGICGPCFHEYAPVMFPPFGRVWEELPSRWNHSPSTSR